MRSCWKSITAVVYPFLLEVALLGLATLLIQAPCSAGELPLPPASRGNLGLEVDVCSFHGADGPYEEITIRIPASHLVYEAEGDSLFVARYRPDLRVLDEAGNLVKQVAGERRTTLGTEDLTHDPERFVDDIAQLRLPPGSYTAHLEVEAVGNGRKARIEFPIHVPAFEPGQLTFSDLYFIRAVDPTDPGPNAHRFKRAGRILLPDPARSVENRPLRFYVELYEIAQLAHSVRFEIRDRFGNTCTVHKREFPTYRDRAGFIEGIPVDDLPPGDYTLRVEAEAGDRIAETERTFRVLGARVSPSSAFTTRHQEVARQTLEHISGPEAANRFRALDGDDRALFLFGHWREHEPWFAETYIGPLTGLGSHLVRPALLRALGLQSTLKKRVDRTYAERLPEPDTLAVRGARKILDFVLDENPEDAYAHAADAVLALEAGYLAEGEVYAKKALALTPDLPEALNARGISQLGRKNWGKAIGYFKTAAAAAPNWTAPRLNARWAALLAGGERGRDELDTLRWALDLAPDHPELFYVTGRLLERHDRLEESAAVYARQVDVNPLHARALFDQGRILFKLDRTDAATAVWRDLMEARPAFRRLVFHQLLDAYFTTGETARAHGLIAQELRTLSVETRNRVEDISSVAGPDELIEYGRLPPEDRAEFVRAFWQKRDPTPATPENERIVEHHRRTFYALKYFSTDGKTWDRRGDVYIRYGEPAFVSRKGAVRYEMDTDVVNVKERLLMSLTPEARQEIKARASRLRTSVRDVEIRSETAGDVEVSDFESIDFELNPNRGYHASIGDETGDYVRGTELSNRDQLGMGEITIRGIPLFPIDGGTEWEYWIYPYVAGGIEIAFTALSRGGDYDYPDISQGRKLARFNQRLWQERRPETVVTKAAKAQPDRYAAPGKTLDFHYATADFRGTTDRSRLEVYLGVPIRDLLEDRSQDVFRRGVALFDSTWTPIFRRVVDVPIRVGEDEDLQAGTLAIDELVLEQPPGRYYLGVQINHPATKRWGSYTSEIVIEDYQVSALQISDIELAGRVTEDSTSTIKGGLRVVPLPSRTYHPGQPIIIYYEVYGLQKDEFGQTRYRVDYLIDPKRGRLSGIRVLRALGRFLGIEEKTIVTISYERTDTEASEHNYLEIDPGNTKEGRFELTVVITDLNAGGSAEKSTVFYINDQK